jgi:DNA repair protein RAD50
MQRLNNFDKHIAERKEKRRSETGNLQDLEEELAGVRKSHMEAVNEHGSLKAEEKVIRCSVFPPYIGSC